MWLGIRKFWLISGGILLVSSQVYSWLQAYGVLPLVSPADEVGLTAGGVLTVFVGIGFIFYGMMIRK